MDIDAPWRGRVSSVGTALASWILSTSPNFSPWTCASSRRAEPIRQEKAAERSLGYAQGLRRRGWPARRDPKGGGSRTTGGVKALARCASTHLHDATVRRTALRGRPARRPARRDAGRITSAGQRRRRPRKAALRVAFPVPSGRRERSAMPRHRRHAPDCRGNGKRDPTCRGIVQGSTGIVARTLFLACRPISAVPHLSLVRKPG